MARKPIPGLRERHSRRCSVEDGGKCSCSPSIEASPRLTWMPFMTAATFPTVIAVPSRDMTTASANSETSRTRPMFRTRYSSLCFSTNPPVLFALDPHRFPARLVVGQRAPTVRAVPLDFLPAQSAHQVRFGDVDVQDDGGHPEPVVGEESA